VFSLVAPDVHSSSEELRHFVDDAVVIECWIDANPEPDIRWLHRYPADDKQEIDLSRQFSQENFEHNPSERIWYIRKEQLNATRWKTSLFIQVTFVCLILDDVVLIASRRSGLPSACRETSDNHFSPLAGSETSD
jgi:hypothetical protein